MASAFLRNTFYSLRGEAELSSPTVQAFDNTLAIFLLVVVGARILIGHAEAHRVIEQDGDLARSGGHGLGLANACRQASVESTQRRIGFANGYRSQA